MTNEKATSTISTYGATANVYKLLRIQGYLMPDRFKVLYVIYAIFVNGYATFYMPFAFTMALAKTKNISADLGAFFTTLQVTFDIYGGSAKVIYIYLMLKKFHGTRTVIDKMDERCTEDDEIAEQKHLLVHGRKIVSFTVTFYLAYSVTTCLGAILKGRPPYACYFPYIDWRNSRWELYLATFLEFIMMDLACLQQALVDSYAVVFIYILLSHMRILMMRIRKLGTKAHLNPKENLQELIMCIKDHKNLLELQSEVRGMISVTVFIQFSLAAIMLGTTLINVMMFSTELSVRLGSCFFLIAITVQSFPVCYYAQSLQNESLKLDHEIFHSQWITQDPEYRKILAFFLHRSQSIMEFDAGKLFPINLASFMSIAKFSFSLYTFIKQMDL